MKPMKEWPRHRGVQGRFGIDGGILQIPFEGRVLTVIISNGGGWDHVSVSLKNRCPNWREMCFVKDLFWNEDEVVVQYHPAKSEYVNNCENCLHMWKPQDIEIPMPPKIMVGI